MLGSAGALQTADGSVSGRMALGARVVLPWRALVAAALLSLALGAALYEGLGGGRSSVAPTAVRSHAFSQKGLLSLPLAAQGPVSAALGGDSADYWVSTDEGGFRAANPAQHLSSSFTSSGVSVSSGATNLGLSLRAVGYGSSLSTLGQVAPRVKGNRVFYAHLGLSEWYANGPLGLEQGFTIPKAPAGYPGGSLTLSLALSGNVQASLAPGGRSITLTRAGKTVLRYTGLSATDARGHLLRSWLQLDGGRLLLRIDTHNARYPLRIDPFIQQGERLTGANELGEGNFGSSVALSSDGNIALVGGPGDNDHVGAAWVFTRSGETWTQQGKKLTGSGEIGPAEFGVGVALSSDGNTALIGAPYDNGFIGAAWVFTRSGETWTQQGEKLTGNGEIGQGGFGFSVALSADGNIALVGGPGAAWVFTRSGETWTQQGEKLTGNGEIGQGLFGWCVALSADGNTALVGGPGDNDYVGAAWVFTRSGETWTQQGKKLTGSGEISPAEFGFSVALSSDGNTALVGGPHEHKGVGAAWVFTRSGEIWTQQGNKLTGSGESGKGQFGESVALSADGNTALIGAVGDNDYVGAAWVFTRSGSTWTQQLPKLVGSGELNPTEYTGQFGESVALSADGNTAMIGGYAYFGAAWVFVREAEYGTCVAQKKGNYTEGNCLSEPVKANKGTYEWKPGPALTCAAQKKGEYTNSSCTVRASKAKKGKYERQPGPGYTSTTGTVTLETPGLGGVLCGASTGAGEITGVTTGVERITYTGCETSGKQCTSEGPNSTPAGKAGTIITNLLDTRLLVSGLGKVWTEFVSAEHDPYLFEFGCEGARFRTFGSLAGVETGNVTVSSLTSTTTFAIGEGEQALYTELSENGGASWVGPDLSSESAVATNTAAEKMEIRT